MFRITKWGLPALAIAALIAFSTVRAKAEPGDDKGPRGKGKITGMVKGEDGAPAAGIKVRLMPPRPPKGEDEGPDHGPGHRPGPGNKPGEDGPPPGPRAAEDGPRDGDKPKHDGDRPPKHDGDGPEGDRPRRQPPKPIAETTTDAEGHFELDVPAGKFSLVAGMRGMGGARQMVEVKDGETVNVTLELKKPKKPAEKE